MLDPRKLRPTELVQLINSGPLGPVLTPRALARDRQRAGLRIGDGKTVDSLRYVAWLIVERHRPRDSGWDYEQYKERMRRRAMEASLSGRDIAPIPAVVNAARRIACERDFRLFCETYFPATFSLPWSRDHAKVIEKVQSVTLEGGLYALAMPRGSGKTTICETAALWAVIYGHRKFVALIAAEERLATSMLESIQTEIETNDALLEDFPEVCYPVRRLDGINQRAAGQLCDGKQTHIVWTTNEVVFPTIAGSRAAGTVIRVAGLTGQIRGMKHKGVDGTSRRPDLVLLDDPQTDESARSPSQCETRERILSGAILGLAGPGRKIAGLMPLTIVRCGDMADRIIDRTKHPEWMGDRTKMVYAFPANEKLWERYAELWSEDLQREDQMLATATEFYRANREAMDAGATVAWPERHEPHELSAIQHAMNLRLRSPEAFAAEYQNEPLKEQVENAERVDADAIAKKVNGLKRGDVPIGCSHLTMFVDVQQRLLYWVVAAWEDDFTGYVIDYGTEPDQHSRYFTLRDAKRTLAMLSKRAGVEGSIYAGLERLVDRVVCKEWRRDDGAMMRIDRCLIDANWGQTSDTIYSFCRQSAHASVLMPSHGKYVGASSIPFSEYKRKKGDRVGLNWRVPLMTGRRAVRHVVFDTNFWKSFVHGRLRVPMADPTCLSLFGRSEHEHRMYSEHLASEYCIRTQGRGRMVDEWKLRAEGLDNHWFDCTVGCAVAASMAGVVLFGQQETAAPRPRIRLSDLQRAKR